jgi:hypothetical protein
MHRNASCRFPFQLRFRSGAIIIAKFELHFKQRDESGVNAADARMRYKMFLSMESAANPAFSAFVEEALTVTIESGVTMRTLGRNLLLQKKMAKCAVPRKNAQ